MTNQYPGNCAQCHQLIEPGCGVIVKSNHWRKPHFPVWHLYCEMHDPIKQAKATAKAINRAWRNNRFAYGCGGFGWDFATWSAVFPQTAKVFNEAIETITGRKGRFMPKS